MKNKILLSLFLLLNPFFILGNNWTDDKNYAEEVNTLIGTKGLGLASGYLYPGATYPFGMVQFTPSLIPQHYYKIFFLST